MIRVVSITWILMTESDPSELHIKTSEYIVHFTRLTACIEKKDKRADAGKTAQLILYVHKNNVSIQRKPFLRRFDVL